MNRLITVLEERIDDLIAQLADAKKEIERLHENAPSNQLDVTRPSDATLDLLSSMTKRSTEDQLQLYIEDSLDLLNPSHDKSLDTDLDNQLSFDLLHQEQGTGTNADNEETKESPMTTDQNLTPHADEQETAMTDVEQTPVESTASNTPEKPALSAEEKRRQKNQKNNRRLIRMLEERYPKAFDWNNPRPLKVGIDKDMTLDEEFNESKQKRAMAAYTRSDRYKKCLLSGQPRIDLEGVAVSDEPALPNAKKPADQKKPMPKGKRPNQATPNKGKSNDQGNRPQKKPKAQPKADPQFDNLSPAERMQAKLAQLLNKN